MKGFKAAFYKDIQLYIKGKRWLAFLLALLVLWMIPSRIDLSSPGMVEPFPIAIRDLDNTFMSRSLISQIRQVELFSDVILLDQEEDNPAQSVAIVTIPKDFFYDAYAFEENPIQISLSEENSLEASIFESIFTSVMDIMKTEQAIAMTKHTRNNPASADPSAMLSDAASRLLHQLLSRQNIFDTETSPYNPYPILTTRLCATIISMMALLMAFAASGSFAKEFRLGIIARYRTIGGNMTAFALSKLCVSFLFCAPILFLLCRQFRHATGATLQSSGIILIIYLIALIANFCIMLTIFFLSKNERMASHISNAFVLFSIFLSGSMFPIHHFSFWPRFAAQWMVSRHVQLSMEALRQGIPWTNWWIVITPFLVRMSIFALLLLWSYKHSVGRTIQQERQTSAKEHLQTNEVPSQPEASDKKDDLPLPLSGPNESMIQNLATDSMQSTESPLGERTYDSLENWKKSSQLSIFIDRIIQNQEKQHGLVNSMSEKDLEKNPNTAFFKKFISLTKFKGLAFLNGYSGLIALSIVALIFGRMVADIRKPQKEPFTLLIVDMDEGQYADRLIERLDSEGLRLIFASQTEAHFALINGAVEGVLTIPSSFSRQIASDGPLLNYQSAATSLSAQGIREIIAGKVIGIRSQLQSIQSIEKEEGQAMSENDRQQFELVLEENLQNFRTLYTMEHSLHYTSEPFVPDAIHFASLASLMSLMSLVTFCIRKDHLRIATRMTTLSGGKTLFYLSDWAALSIIGTLVTLLVMGNHLSGAQTLLAIFFYNTCIAALLLAQSRNKERWLDIETPFVALIIALIGGAFMDWSLLTPTAQKITLLSPIGQLSASTNQWEIMGLLMAETLLFLYIGIRKTLPK